MKLVSALVAGLVLVAAAGAAPDLLRDPTALVAKFAELKPRVLAGRPLQVAGEDWDAARSVVRSDEAWRVWARATQARLDAWMSEERDRADWIAGYPHDLVDPATGLPLRWTLQTPEPIPGATGTAQRKLHQAWVAFQRGYNLDRIQEAARIYRLTGERRYADWAAGQLDFYAVHYMDWPLQQLYGSRSRMLGQGLDEATAVTRVIDGVRLLGNSVAAERRAMWRDRLFMPIVDNLREAKVGINNISLWHAVATAVIGMEFDDQRLVQEAIDGPAGVRAVMRTGLTTDFIWYEGSLGYQTYVLRALAPLFVQAALHGRAGELQIEMLQAQNMLLAPLALRFDDGMLPTPGDTTARLKAVDRDFFMELRRAVPTSIGLAEAARRRSWDELLDPVPADSALSEVLPPVRSMMLDSIRMALLKSQGWQVFFRYGQLTQHHSHEDALNHEIYFGDTPLSTDPGTVLYGTELHENYFRRAIAHNVALVDGGGQIGWDPGELLAFDPTAATIRAAQPRYRPDAVVQRQIRIVDGQLLDRMTTTLKPIAVASKRLGFLFHTDCRLDLDTATAGPALPAGAPVGRGFSFWEQVTVRDVSVSSSGRLYCGARVFKAHWTWGTAGRLYVAQVPSTPVPRRRTAVYFETVGRDASVELRLQPLAAEPAAR